MRPPWVRRLRRFHRFLQRGQGRGGFFRAFGGHATARGYTAVRFPAVASRRQGELRSSPRRCVARLRRPATRIAPGHVARGDRQRGDRVERDEGGPSPPPGRLRRFRGGQGSGPNVDGASPPPRAPWTGLRFQRLDMDRAPDTINRSTRGTRRIQEQTTSTPSTMAIIRPVRDVAPVGRTSRPWSRRRRAQGGPRRHLPGVRPSAMTVFGVPGSRRARTRHFAEPHEPDGFACGPRSTRREERSRSQVASRPSARVGVARRFGPVARHRGILNRSIRLRTRELRGNRDRHVRCLDGYS